jgi:hypothetical protein
MPLIISGLIAVASPTGFETDIAAARERMINTNQPNLTCPVKKQFAADNNECELALNHADISRLASVG